MSGQSLLQLMETKLATLIEQVRAEPYNFVWGPSNVRDMAKADYPNACIYLESELNLDDQGGAWSQEYVNEVTFRIEVRARLDAQYDNPPVEVRRLLYMALDDLKMLFGNNWNLDGLCDTIMYRGMEIIEEASGDIFIPSKLITRWRVQYEQSRLTAMSATQ